MTNVIIIGGGLSGLITSILLKRSGLSVLLLEKSKYPFHRVCGEYISNEVAPFLKKNDLFPSSLDPPQITQLQISSLSGRSFIEKLDPGGFGVSRYSFDHWLAKKAKEEGVVIKENCAATDIKFEHQVFTVTTKNKVFHSHIVIGSHGKRSLLDKQLERTYLKNRSPFVGVKYHIKASLPDDIVSLHNFNLGYCGVSKVEGEKFNLCYMTHRDNIRKQGSIQDFEQAILMKNPHLKHLFENSEFIFNKPYVINEIQFSKKDTSNQHILFTGDAAGTIVPLTGNGMAMAIRSAKLLSMVIIQNWKEGPALQKIEKEYSHLWNKHFESRIRASRQIQYLFGSAILSEFTVTLGKYCRPVSRALIRKTHGQPFT